MTPNPGSDEAVGLGCTCAVLDNNHGKYAPYFPDGWWITGGCPVHAPIKQPSEVGDVERREDQYEPR